MKYLDFLASKAQRTLPTGMEPGAMPDHLFDYQKDVVQFAIRQGRAALFLDTGLGKTACELEWCKQTIQDGMGLILTPLAVARQIEAEGKRWGYNIRVIRDQSQALPGLNVCNYDRLDKLDLSKFTAVVLDESSILKSSQGSMRAALTQQCASVPFRLCCTATPAPNDNMELGSHAEFLGVMSSQEMLTKWFTNDTSTASQSWRLKGHAVGSFWDWVASWARCAETPADLGYDASRFILPPLNIRKHNIMGQVEIKRASGLFAADVSATNMFNVKRQTATVRAKEVARLYAQEPNETWLIWCDTDFEADALCAELPHAIDLRGSMSLERKEDALQDFIGKPAQTMITKPGIAGAGLNFQHCARMAFVGRSFSYEAWYQAVRRCWRFGQKRPVDVHLVVADGEDQIGRVIDRKADGHASMKREMAAAMLRNTGKQAAVRVKYKPEHTALFKDQNIACLDHAKGKEYDVFHGDCVAVARQFPDACIDFSVYSPPFASLFTYSDSEADMGNNTTDAEFRMHYGFLIKEMTRITKLGRLSAVHCSDLPYTKWKDGRIGIKDFSGDIVRLHEENGWTLHSRVTIWRDPVVEMTRTKALGLLHKQVLKDSTRSRVGMPDYLLVFRAPGENTDPVEHSRQDLPVERWQKLASPVWMDIRQTFTINSSLVTGVNLAKSEKDEKHLCPLQIDVIENALFLWSNPGDLILSPFMGVGSEGFVCLKNDRRFVGIELKDTYYQQAIGHLNRASKKAGNLFAT